MMGAVAAAFAAARVREPVAHSYALAGFLLGSVVGSALSMAFTWGAGFIAGVLGSVFGPVGGIVAGITASYYVDKYLDEIGFVGFFQNVGEAIGSLIMQSPTGRIEAGSIGVFINCLSAGRVGDPVSCHNSYVAEGSASVFIDRRPAARYNDRITCGAKVVSGSPSVRIGGESVVALKIASEVSDTVRGWVSLAIAAVDVINGLKGLVKIGKNVLMVGKFIQSKGFVGAVNFAIGWVKKSRAFREVKQSFNSINGMVHSSISGYVGLYKNWLWNIEKYRNAGLRMDLSFVDDAIGSVIDVVDLPDVVNDSFEAIDLIFSDEV